MVDRFQGHAAGEGAIADHGDAFEVFTALIPGQGHAQGRRDRGGGMAGTEVVEAAFTALEITSHAALLAQGVKALPATGEQLVGIGLVAHVPHHPIAVEIEGLVQSQGEFHHPEARTEMAAAGGNHLKMLVPDLASDGFQFSDAEAMQLVGMAQLTWMHTRSTTVKGNLRLALWQPATSRSVGLVDCQTR